MNVPALERIATSDLEIAANDRDLLQDMAIFLEYVRTHSIKRMVRSNDLPKPDSLRIARLMGDPELEQAVKETGGAAWIIFIDDLAFQMDLISYDIEGEYTSYTSSSASYYDNYVILNESAYQQFLDLTPAHQQKKLLNTLIKRESINEYHYDNEFYDQGVLGSLDSFSPYGSASGSMPAINFPAVRRFLLELLAGCESGVWFSSASLIAFLKANHPHFLIPQTLPTDRSGKIPERYSSFHDGPERWSNKHVAADAPDAFERVEGRYVERFLEGILLEMGFVEVAYSRQPYENLFPMMGHLQAFRISERFSRLMHDQIAQPRISVLPNFDVIVESEVYPLSLMNQLDRLAERVSSPNNGTHASVITLQLKKERIAAELVRNPDLDVSALLRKWSTRDLPANVLVELAAWSGHAEQFILYQGFGLLESTDALPQADPFTTEHIRPGLRLVHHPYSLFKALESDALVPLVVQHENRLAPLPEKANTCFPRQTSASQPSGPQALHVARTTQVCLRFPSEQSFDDFRKALAEARCPIQVDIPLRTISFAQQHQPLFTAVLAQLSDRYQVDIQDLLQ